MSADIVGHDSVADNGAKQDPASKSQRALAADGRVYFSYSQIAATVSSAVPEVNAFRPDVMIAIGGGGWVNPEAQSESATLALTAQG